jgi:4-amino-4-deoxy-L-arabinose transferase-like glycosyltransferase
MKKKILAIIIGLCYFSIHIFQLTRFPVFADEAIYIRWSQLIMDDWKQYLFFPLNDGKTPLFIWLLIPFQYLFEDQLFAARLFSVVIGFTQIVIIKILLEKLGAEKKFQWLGMFLTALLPFWYFQAHVALMDGLFTLFLSLTILGCLHQIGAVKVNEKSSFLNTIYNLTKNKKVLMWSFLTGLFFGFAFWTKLPALFMLPLFPLFVLLPQDASWKKRAVLLFPLGLSAFLGVVMFATLRISPAFGQLFSRGNDFTYPVSEVLFHGIWKHTLASIPTYFGYFLSYLTIGMVILSFAGLFSNRSRRKTIVFLLAAAFFAGPFVVFGKVIYARYLFPSALFITMAAILNLQAMYQHWIVESHDKQLITKSVASLIAALLLANTVTHSAIFIGTMLFSPDSTPFVSSDRAQYLEDWSSGQGIWETSQYIKHQAQSHTVAVATEGRFGTLPDGLLLYFHRQNVQNIYIEGTGQYPVKTLPEFFVSRAKNFDQSLLVVNSNRMEIKLPPAQLLGQYCRPHNTSCLQVWDITAEVKK